MTTGCHAVSSANSHWLPEVCVKKNSEACLGLGRQRYVSNVYYSICLQICYPGQEDKGYGEADGSEGSLKVQFQRKR